MGNSCKIFRLLLIIAFCIFLDKMSLAVDSQEEIGKLNLLVLGTRMETDFLPLQQNYHINYTYIHCWDTGRGQYQIEKLEKYLSQEELVKTNVILISGWDKYSLKEKWQRIIMDWVKKGGNLIYVPRGTFENEPIEEILPSRYTPSFEGKFRRMYRKPHPLTLGIPFEFFPKNLSWQITTSSKEAEKLLSMDPFGDILSFQRVEKGKVACLMFLPMSNDFALALPAGDIPSFKYGDLYYCFWNQLVKWMAYEDKIYPVSIDLSVEKKSFIAGEPINLKLNFYNWSYQKKEVIASIMLKNTDGIIVSKKEINMNVPKVGDYSIDDISINTEDNLVDGYYQIDAVAKDGDRELHHALNYMEIKGQIETTLTTDKEYYNLSDNIKVKAGFISHVKKTLDKARIWIRIIDVNARVIDYHGKETTLIPDIKTEIGFDFSKISNFASGKYLAEIVLLFEDKIWVKKSIPFSFIEPFDLKNELVFAPSFLPESFPPYDNIINQMFSIVKESGFNGVHLHGGSNLSVKLVENYGLKSMIETSTPTVTGGWDVIRIFDNDEDLIKYLKKIAMSWYILSPSIKICSLTEEGALAQIGTEIYYRAFLKYLKEEVYKGDISVFNTVCGLEFQDWNESVEFNWVDYFKEQKYGSNPILSTMLSKFNLYYPQKFFATYRKILLEDNPYIQTSISTGDNYNADTVLDIYTFQYSIRGGIRNLGLNIRRLLNDNKPGNDYMWAFDEGEFLGEYKTEPYFPSEVWWGLSSGVKWFSIWTGFGTNFRDGKKLESEAYNALFHPSLSHTTSSMIFKEMLNKIRPKRAIITSTSNIVSNKLLVYSQQDTVELLPFYQFLYFSGFSPDVINNENKLIERISKYKMVIFNNIESMNTETIELVEKFVKDGGVVLFTSSALFERDNMGRKYASPGGNFRNILSVTGDKEISVNNYGKGKAILVKSDPVSSPAILENLIVESIGEERLFRVTDKGGNQISQSVIFNGLTTKDGLIKYIVIFNSNYDSPDDIAVNIHLFDDNLHVYDVFEEKEVSLSRNASGQYFPVRLKPVLKGTEGKIYALVPYQVSGIAIKPKTSSIMAGEIIELSISILDKMNQRVKGRHPVYLWVEDEEGKRLAVYDRELMIKGEVMIALPIAFNAPAGRWCISAQDCSSGLKASTLVDVTVDTEYAIWDKVTIP